MKICFFRHSLRNRGGDKMVVEYANHLTSQGHDVVILTNVVNTVFKVQARIEHISKGKKKIATILNAVFKKRDYDFIIADIIIMNFLLSLRNRGRLLYFAQDYDESYYNSLFMRLLVRVVYFVCLRIIKMPVIAVFQELGRLLRERFRAAVSVVPNGVDTTVFYPESDQTFLSLKGDRKVVLVFARSDFRKGFDIAIEVLMKLRKDMNDGSPLVWAVGEDLDAPFPIKNFGFVPPETLRKILTCSDVLLYPSRHEGLPLFVLEAMACGCPVVTTEAVGFVRHGSDALQSKVEDVKNLADHVTTLINNESIRTKIIREAFRTAGQFDLNYSLKEFEHELSTKIETIAG